MCNNALTKYAHEHTGSAESIRPSLRNGFNGLFRALPGDEFILSPSLADKACPSPVGPTRLRQFSTSNGCQDHTALPYASAPLVWRAPIAHGVPPCDRPRATTLPRPPHPAPNVRDDGQRPSVRARDSGKYAGDLPRKETGIFFQAGLDRWNRFDRAKKIGASAQGAIKLCRLNGCSRQRCWNRDHEKRGRQPRRPLHRQSSFLASSLGTISASLAD